MTAKSSEKLNFITTIHDNIHGNIQLTELELKLINTPEFQRLRHIKQLGLLDYIFPGAVHNRFSHSLGVMHIADSMVLSLQLKGQFNHKDNIRKKCRIAGLLHDIGHYPWSHIIEDVVVKDLEIKIKSNPKLVDSNIVEIDESNPEIKEIKETSDKLEETLIGSKIHKFNYEVHKNRNNYYDYAHHERMAGIVIDNSKIKDILLESGEFTEEDVIDIIQIIAGSSSSPERLIIHSEMDADRFDYLLRDSKNIGVIYGLFDINRIIQNLDYSSMIDPLESTTGLFILKKAQKAVEDFLIARYFLYSTVIFQKTSIGFHKLASLAYEGLLERDLVYSYCDILKIFENGDLVNYYDYTDNYFISILKEIEKDKIKLENNDAYKIPADQLKDICNKILIREPLKLVKEEQIMYNSSNSKPTSDLEIYFEKAVEDKIIEQAGIKKEWYIKSEIDQGITTLSPFVPVTSPDNYDNQKIEGIRILNSKNKPIFLVQDEASIIKKLSDLKLNIKGIYTKDDSYRDAIQKAIDEYEELRTNC